MSTEANYLLHLVTLTVAARICFLCSFPHFVLLLITIIGQKG